MSGYIRLYRGWRDCDVFGDEPFTERDAWLWLVEHAAWKPMTRTNLKGERFRIERGQLHVSLRALEKTFGWGKNKVARFFVRLVDHEMVGTATGQSGTILTICNYAKYQDERDSRDTETGTVAGQSRDTQEEGKERKEEKVEPRKRGRTTDFEIPDWVPSEPWAAFAAMRRSLKAPIDDYIAKRMFTKLERIGVAGWDTAKVLDKATINRWKDLYEPTPGRDDDMRANAAPGSDIPAPMDEASRKAYLTKLDAAPFAAIAPRPEPPPRRPYNGGAKPFGDLAQRVANG